MVYCVSTVNDYESSAGPVSAHSSLEAAQAAALRLAEGGVYSGWAEYPGRHHGWTAQRVGGRGPDWLDIAALEVDADGQE
jgi:hypothetical protein